MTDTSESKVPQETNEVVSGTVAAPVAPSAEITEPVVDSENTEEKTDNFVRTRKGDNIGNTAKRQRLLKKEPDTWVCFMIMSDIYRLNNFIILCLKIKRHLFFSCSRTITNRAIVSSFITGVLLMRVAALFTQVRKENQREKLLV